MHSNVLFLKDKARFLRRVALQMALDGGKGHLPPSFSWADIASVLFYGGILKFKPDNPKWVSRDRFILSKGHACLTLYAAMSDLGFFDTAHLKKFVGGGALLPGHPDIEIPGVEVCSGSLGHGLGVATGMALSAKLSGKTWQSYVVLGDGECHEGSVWEAAMFAGHQKLGRLVAIIDRNGLGATDFTENYASLDPLDERFAAFGWDVVKADGHDFGELLGVFESASQKEIDDKPLCVIARTTKGKGVRFMENSKEWHHKMPKGEQIKLAWDDLGGEP